MNFIRSILSYSLLIILIVAAVGGFYYRQQLQPHIDTAMDDVEYLWDEYVQPEVDKQIEQASVETDQQSTVVENKTQTEHELESFAQESTSADKTNDVQAGDIAQITEESVVINETVEEVPRQETGDNTQVNVQQEIQNQLTESVSEEPVVVTESVVETNVSEPVSVVAANDTASENMNKTSEMNKDQLDTQTIETEMLNNARNAYWKGDIKAAISAYNTLIDTNPAEANYYGELGNVFYSSGQWKAAGSHYYKAANLLIEQNKPQQVGYLHYVLQGLDKELAEKLASKMSSHN